MAQSGASRAAVGAVPVATGAPDSWQGLRGRPTPGTGAVTLGLLGLVLGLRDRRFLLLPALIVGRALWRTATRGATASTAAAPRRRVPTPRPVSAVATDYELAERNDRYAG